MKPVQVWEVKLETVQFHKCDQCPKAFLKPEELRSHVKRHKARFLKHARSSYVKIEKVDFLDCDTCGQKFLNKKALLLHRVKHINQTVKHTKQQQNKLYDNKSIPKPYQCPECDYKFAARSTLDAHSVIHQDFPHVCHCGIGYYKQQDLKNHIKLVQCKPKIEDIKFNNIAKEAKETFKVKFSFNKKVEKSPKLKAEVSVKPQPVILPPLDIEFERDKSNKFQCPKCLKLFTAKRHAQLHYRSIHRGERPYVCHLCSKAFTQPGAVKKHIQQVHIAEKNFECQYCDKSFTSLDLQIRHERIHTGYKPHKCSYCEKAFSDPSAHIRHERIHTGDKRYRCALCPKAFTDHSALYAHKKRHANQKDYKCEKCGKRFYGRSYLVKHVNVVHNRQLDYTCQHCNKDFSSKANLSSHIQRKHSDSRDTYTCHLCFKTLADKMYLLKHLKIVHEKRRPYTCEYCDKQFAYRNYLIRHLPLHTNNKKFECDYCRNTYYSKAILTSHILRVHIAIYCKACHRYFCSNSDFNKHKLKTSEQCEICDKEFHCKGGLSSHFQSHVKRKSVYECDYCGNVYTSRQSITRHIFGSHA